MVKRTLLLLAPLILSTQATAFSEEEESSSLFLKGKVLDSQGHSVAGAKVVVHDEDHNDYKIGKSNAQGEFEVEHQQCNHLSFDVLPPPKLELSPAHYANVTGELSKHFIVQLKHGFKVSGRILSAGKGLKGIDIKFNAHEQSGKAGIIHGGGFTTTKGDGSFALLLTPGKKVIEIRNDRYPKLSPLYQHEVTITGDTILPEISLPEQR